MTSSVDPLAGRPLLAFAIRNGAAFVLAGVLLYVMLAEQRAQMKAIHAQTTEMVTIIHALAGRCLPINPLPIK